MPSTTAVDYASGARWHTDRAMEVGYHLAGQPRLPQYEYLFTKATFELAWARDDYSRAARALEADGPASADLVRRLDAGAAAASSGLEMLQTGFNYPYARLSDAESAALDVIRATGR